jgi:hypothetical protein
VLETQHMHIVESSTREMKIQQAIGRVVRYRSHMVEGRKPMPKKEQVVHIWRYWSTSDSEPFRISKTVTKPDGSSAIIEKVFVNKTTTDEILYNKGRIFVNGMQSFLNLLKKASITSYDEKQDKEGKLKDYGMLSISPKLLEAFDISNKRYEENKDVLESDMSTDISKLVKDVELFVDEEKDDTK